MTDVFLWIMTLGSIAALVGCLLRLRLAHRRVRLSQTSLHQVTLKVQSLEEGLRSKDIHRDTTEEKLRGYLQLLDALINAMPNPIFFKDSAGVFQGCNKMFARNILGLTRDRIMGRRSQDLPDQIPPDLAGRYQREEMKMLEKDAVHSFEAPVQCADGIRREFLFSMAPVLEHHAQSCGWVAVLADLTDKNRATLDRLEKEKLASVLETAGAVCHELNQPLQALSGYTELLAVKLDMETEAFADLGRIMAQIERIGIITAKLQGITRYETMDYAQVGRIIDIHKASD